MAKRSSAQRAERRAAEAERESAARAARERRHRRLRFVGMATVGLLAVIVGAVATTALTGEREREPVPADVQRTADAQLRDGYYAGRPPWPPEYSELDARVETLDLPGGFGEDYHIHVLLSVFVDGEQVEVPANIGIPPGGGHVPLHTHTPDGVVHVEAPGPHPYHLKDIFTVWGVRFDGERIGGVAGTADGPLTVFVNGNELTDDPGAYEFEDRDNIVVAVGDVASVPKLPDPSALDRA